MTREIRISADSHSMARKAAKTFLDICETTLLKKQKIAVALSGGKTPLELYGILSDSPYRDKIPWKKIHIFWGDERCVSPNDPESNFRQAWEYLLSKVDILPDQIHRIYGESSNPVQAARNYENEILNFFQATEDEPPAFDLILLGLGKDGHTASLFPSGKLFLERHHWVGAEWIEYLNSYRISMTLPIINAAENVMFLVSGKDKAETFRKIVTNEQVSHQFPAHFIEPKGQLIWEVDKDCASLLEAKEIKSYQSMVPAG